jgi:hypothetical protein
LKIPAQEKSDLGEISSFLVLLPDFFATKETPSFLPPERQQ